MNEFIGLSIVAVVFLQMANTLQEDRHVSNDIIIRLIADTHPRLSAALYSSFHLIGALLMAIIVIYVWPILVENYQGGYYNGTAGFVEIKIWPFMAVVVIGAAHDGDPVPDRCLASWCARCRPQRGLTMSEIAIGAICFLASLVLIQTGMHIGVALMLLSFVGVWAIKGLAVAGKLLSSSVATSIASDAYAVIPLFVLMGLFVSATDMGRDTFDVAALVLRRIRGGLGIATVAANAVFAACTGTTIASASVFTKVAVPEMMRHGHTAGFSVGVVAGSSVLGMLIPPSILMIIFGVIANVSIGDLFTSGILPGIVLATAFCVTILLMAYLRPDRWRSIRARSRATITARWPARPTWQLVLKIPADRILVGTVLGGIYGGFFTPTEAGGAGALAAFLIALARRELTLKKFWEVALETGRVTAAICFLLMAAAALLADADACPACPTRSANGCRTPIWASCRC